MAMERETETEREKETETERERKLQITEKSGPHVMNQASWESGNYSLKTYF